MKIKGKKVVSIKPVCTKEEPCLLCSSLGVKKGESLQCSFCNMKNKLIVKY